MPSRSSLKFEDVREASKPIDNSFMGKYLRQIENDKKMSSDLLNHVKKDRPKVTAAELMRDFRVDEEEGMDSDTKLESKSANHIKLALADQLSSMKLPKDKTINTPKPNINMS